VDIRTPGAIMQPCPIEEVSEITAEGSITETISRKVFVSINLIIFF